MHNAKSLKNKTKEYIKTKTFVGKTKDRRRQFVQRGDVYKRGRKGRESWEVRRVRVLSEGVE